MSLVRSLESEIETSKQINKKLTIANPTSAFFKAGPSFVPSPVTATTSRVGFIFDFIIPLTSTYLSCGDERANTRNCGHILSNKP